MNEETALVRKAIEILEDRKGENVVVIDLSDVSIPTSYFVIGEADNSVHMKAIASHFMKSFPIKTRGREGLGERRWVVMDYGDIIVHIFHKDARAFYDLESLWADHIVSRDALP
ncbi:ribosome silencing factor [Candidatus Bipolaricaulota bacterium]|nr:ribosome silencing factor [Candidatus Bipolaricaulota bacterium]TFH11859.1 MAG: ribosome silencing factor [Candidatus Atribacteria bacterium]